MILNYTKEAYYQLSRGYEIEVPYFDHGNGNFLLDMDSILKFSGYAKSFSGWIPVDSINAQYTFLLWKLNQNGHKVCNRHLVLQNRYQNGKLIPWGMF